MSKYIIKNCPCLDNSGVCQRCKNWGVESCQDCTDCVMKQIVERCKKVRECTADICTNPYEYATYYETRGVLELLDIQKLK